MLSDLLAPACLFIGAMLIGVPFVSPLLTTFQENSHPLYGIYRGFVDILPNSGALFLGTFQPPSPYNWYNTSNLYFHFQAQAAIQSKPGTYGIVVIEAPELDENYAKRLDDLVRYADKFLVKNGYIVVYDASEHKIVMAMRGSK